MLQHSLFFCSLATDVVTVYVFHEPSLLSSLQDKDLTGVVLQSLVVKDVSKAGILNIEAKYSQYK